MCGICRLRRRSGARAARAHDRQRCAIEARMATATSVADGVGLGHRRLSIIDVAGGRQPIENEDGSLVLIQNGEIYNHRELRQRASGARPPFPDRLRLRGHPAPLRGARSCVPGEDGRHVDVRALRPARSAGSCSRAIGWASSRCTTSRPAAASCSPPRSSRCCASTGFQPTLDLAGRRTTISRCATCRVRAACSRKSASCRPRTTRWSRTDV